MGHEEEREAENWKVGKPSMMGQMKDEWRDREEEWVVETWRQKDEQKGREEESETENWKVDKLSMPGQTKGG